MPPSEREELAIIVAANGPSVVKIADRILAVGYRKGGGEPTEAMVQAAIISLVSDTGVPATFNNRNEMVGLMDAARLRSGMVRNALRAALRAQEGTK